MLSPEEAARRVSEVLATVKVDLDSSDIYPRRQLLLDRVMLALVSKLIRVSEAICLLVERGFYGEAYGLARTSVEGFLLTKFIGNKDPEARAKSYLDFRNMHLVNREEFRKVYFPEEVPPDRETQGIIDATKKKFGTRTCWESAYNMADEIYLDPRELDSASAKGFQATHDYRGVYEHTSHFVHCGSVSIIRSHFPEAGRPFRTRADTSSQIGHAFLALTYTLAYLQMACIIALGQLGLILNNETTEAINSTRGLIQSALDSHGIVTKPLHAKKRGKSRRAEAPFKSPRKGRR